MHHLRKSDQQWHFAARPVSPTCRCTLHQTEARIPNSTAGGMHSDTQPAIYVSAGCYSTRTDRNGTQAWLNPVQLTGSPAHAHRWDDSHTCPKTSHHRYVFVSRCEDTQAVIVVDSASLSINTTLRKSRTLRQRNDPSCRAARDRQQAAPTMGAIPLVQHRHRGLVDMSSSRAYLPAHTVWSGFWPSNIQQG